MRTWTGRSGCTTSTPGGCSERQGPEILDEIGAFAADLSPDGSTFAVATASEVYRYDTATLRIRGRDLEAGAGDYIEQLEFSHDGSLIAGATREGQLVVWDAESGVVRHRFAEPGVSWGIAFSADDQTLFSSSADAVRSWDLTGQRGLFSLGRMPPTPRSTPCRFPRRTDGRWCASASA